MKADDSSQKNQYPRQVNSRDNGGIFKRSSRREMPKGPTYSCSALPSEAKNPSLVAPPIYRSLLRDLEQPSEKISNRLTRSSSSAETSNQNTIETQLIIDHVQVTLAELELEVTNIPSKVGYTFTANNEISERSYIQATITTGMRAHLKPSFWRKLASSVEYDGCGRCNGLSALAAKKLESFANENGLGLYIAGILKYEHNLLIISKVPLPLQDSKMSKIDISDYPDAITVDLWQHNLYRQLGSATENTTSLVDKSDRHMYTSGAGSYLEISCLYNTP